MDKIQDIENASIELMQGPDCVMTSDDPEMVMLKRLEAEGHKTISIGRATLTIERCTNEDEIPDSLKNQWGCLKLSIYPDPSVYPNEKPNELYISANKYGDIDNIVQVHHSGNIIDHLLKLNNGGV